MILAIAIFIVLAGTAVNVWHFGHVSEDLTVRENQLRRDRELLDLERSRTIYDFGRER